MKAARKFVTEEVGEAMEGSDDIDQMIDNVLTNHPVAAVESELDVYLRPLLKYPMLKKKEYVTLFERYKNGDPREKLRVRDVIMYSNTRLVLSIALRHRHRGLPLSDLIQEGMIGCMRAIETYEIEKGFAFSTYATQWIRQAMTRAIQNKGEIQPYRIPSHEVEKIQFIRKLYLELCVQKARPPKELEVFQRAKTSKTGSAKNLTLSDVVRIMRGMFTGQTVRLDAPASAYDGETETVLDRLNVGPAKTETLVEARRLYAEYKLATERIEEAVSELPPRTAMVIRLRLGLGEFEARTFEEIAERYELTRERIRQIEVDGFETLQSKLKITRGEIESIIKITPELEVIIHAG